MGCCGSGGYDELFDARQARRDLRRYRRRGLRPDARRGVDFVRSRGVEGATVLEPGGGIGALQVELLRAGAARAVNVELSRGYEAVAAELLAGEGLADRVERLLGDFAEEPAEPADVVVMNRVVCCYPDPVRLVGAAAERSGRLLLLTYPVDNLVARLVVGVMNAGHRLSRSEFRAYAHPHRLIREAAERHGLRLAHRSRGLVWHTAVFER